MFVINGAIVVSIFMTILLVTSHILFYFENKLSLDNTILNTTMELSTKPLRMVVFDLDETLGSFIEISMFWEALELYYGYNLLEDRFF